MSNWAFRTIRGLFLLIDSLVYWLGSIAYRVFYLVSDARIFDNDEAFSRITTRIYTILGIVMLFVLAYNIILIIINPDKLNDKSDKSLSGILKNTLISIILIVLLPTIFNYMQIIQHDIIDSNVIGNIILGGTSTTEYTDRKYAGKRVMINIFTAFYHPVDSKGAAITPYQCLHDQDIYDANPICETYLTAKENAEGDNEIGEFINNKELNDAVTSGEMEYIFIISTIAGGIAAYLFISFALDVGVRVVKLGVLQVISPIPVILRITKPSGGMFSKWLKELTDTYLSVFIRLAVVFFVMFTISLVTEVDLWAVDNDALNAAGTTAYVQTNDSNVELLTNTINTNDDNTYEVELLANENTVSPSSNENGILKLIANVIVILGALQFAKDAPKLIENLIGSNGKITWRIKDKLNENEYAKRAISGVGAIGGNFAKEALNLAANTKKAEKGTRTKAFFSGLGSSVTRLPGNVVYGAYRGWRNGGVDISQMGNAVGTSMGETTSMFDARNAKKENNKLLREQYNIPKILGFGNLAANALDFNNVHLKDWKWLDELVDKINNNKNTATNASNAYKAWTPAAEYLNKGISDINEAEKKAKTDAMKEYEAAYAKAKSINDENLRKAEISKARSDYDTRVEAIKSFYDARRDEQRKENMTKYSKIINKALATQAKPLSRSIAALSTDEKNSLFNGTTRIKNIDQLATELNQGHIDALAKQAKIDHENGISNENSAAFKELLELSHDLGIFNSKLKGLDESSKAIYTIENSANQEKKDKK